MREIGVGLLGLGNVGIGVAKGLAANGELIAGRTGFRLAIRRIAVRDPAKERAFLVDPSLFTTDPISVIEDDAVEVVVEMIGGTTIARELTLRALELKKPVVTANKALLAEFGGEIFGRAEAENVDLYFESSVGGGIPIIRSLREGLIGTHIDAIYGILNGTCNYILTRMEREGLALLPALEEAQDSGFAEAEPSLDIDGWDTAHKAVILAALAYGFTPSMEDVEVHGIRDVSLEDIKEARRLGYAMKLLACIRHLDDGISIRVQPTLVPQDNLLASVHGVFNAVLVDSRDVGETMYYGKGAGTDPTASAVLSDLVDVGRNLISGSERRVPALARHNQYGGTRSADDMVARYYLRILLQDQPGMLARLAHVLGDHGISIASVHQSIESRDGHVTVVLVTHHSLEREFAQALDEIDRMNEVGGPTVRYRIEDFNKSGAVDA